MALDNPVRAVTGQLLDSIFNSVLIFGLIIIVVGVLGFVMWYFFVHKKKFDIITKIRSERADGSYKIIFDKAAILIDRKTKTKHFKLWNAKTELMVPDFEVIQDTTWGDMIELLKTGEDSYTWLKPAVIDKKALEGAKDEDGNLKVGQYQEAIPSDVSFWSAKRKDHDSSLFSTDGLLYKILPWIPHILGGAILIFVLYILMDNLPQILGELRQLTSELNSLKGADVVSYS